MGKFKSVDVLALDKTKQKEVVRNTKVLKQQLKEERLKAAEKRGLIYLGHLPHGFYEDEISSYFQQFGKVTNVKVCRSKKTGNSKGYGFVEFSHPEVAQIAADTMNNYLMFKKRIVAKYVPFAEKPRKIFYGKNRSIRRVNKVASKNNLTKLQKKLEKIEKYGICVELP